MGDVSLNRPIKTEPAAGDIAPGNRILDPMSAGWTDERHMLYITSMEASFIEQLHSVDHRSQNVNQNDDGFKVLRRGIWENLKFERTNARARNVGEGRLSANPWIRHFRSSSAVRNAQDSAIANSVDDHESGTQTIRGRIQSHGRESRVCKAENLPSAQTRGCNLVDKRTEVSDQNFPDEEVEVDAESSKAFKKKKLSPSMNLRGDQVVPSEDQMRPQKLMKTNSARICENKE